MESFSFVLKTILVTAALIWVCQFKIEGKPVERHFMDFVQGSNVTDPIHKIAEGSRRLGSDAWTGFQGLVGGTAIDTKPATTLKASTFEWSESSDEESEE